MHPLRLSLKNFCSHLETEFSFNDFSSALIIGKVKNNDRFSNGAGKSTIFNAIEYVLFNEIHFSSLDKIIRDGCDVCRVEFDFISSIDKATYRIIRSNSRKAGTDVRLSKQIDNNEWEDLTQRRVSDTEKEIVKIIGFSYKAFCASVLFSQFGSENNVQKDYGNLPYLTPEKRKSVLREVLQLYIYSNYEKLAKTKYNNINIELEKYRTTLTTLEESNSNYIFLIKEKNNLTDQLSDKEKLIPELEKNLAKLNTEYTILIEKLTTYKSKISELKIRESSCKEAIFKSQKSILEMKEELTKLPIETKQIQAVIEEKKSKINKFKLKTNSIKEFKDTLDKLISNIIINRSNFNAIINKIKESNKPITEDKICNNCHQSVSEEHKHNWMQKVTDEIIVYEHDRKILDDEYNNLLKERQIIEKSLSNAIENDKYINNVQSVIESMLKEIESKEIVYKHYSSLLAEHIESEKNKSKELNEINEVIKQILPQNNDENLIKSERLKIAIRDSKSDLDNILNLRNKLNSELAVINHQIEICINNKQKAIEIKKNIKELEKSLLVYSKIIQAFGSNGIPALITHSILDELQEEANKWLMKLRPGLQLQFMVINDKNNKEKEDTLDILYFIDGNQREYKQLSGAQKIIVSLSIKLSLLFIMNKRLGIDIKLILLDEVDQALDPGSTEIFADIIRIIQEEFKVIVITHDEDIKHKFSHAILVEQDENNISRGKLINW